MLEDQEARIDKEATRQTPTSPLSLDEAVLPLLPSMANDFQQFEDLIKRVADVLQIPLFMSFTDRSKGGHNLCSETIKVAIWIH